MSDEIREDRSPRRPVAVSLVTCFAALVALYVPPLSAAPWMWAGGQMHPVASLLFTGGPAAAWLLWFRRICTLAPPRGPVGRDVVTGSAVLTVMYMVVTTWDVAGDRPASSVTLWPPAITVTIVGVAAIARATMRLWRR